MSPLHVDSPQEQARCDAKYREAHLFGSRNDFCWKIIKRLWKYEWFQLLIWWLTMVREFPALAMDLARVQEGKPSVNCFGFAFGIEGWLDVNCPNAWPDDVPRHRRPAAWLKAAKRWGYARTHNEADALVALYVADGFVTHAAKKDYNDRRWKSKIGAACIISNHRLNSISSYYGQPKILLTAASEPLKHKESV
jgi:hypothetical protein